jgi:hypothetical protein
VVAYRADYFFGFAVFAVRNVETSTTGPSTPNNKPTLCEGAMKLLSVEIIGIFPACAGKRLAKGTFLDPSSAWT